MKMLSSGLRCGCAREELVEQHGMHINARGAEGDDAANSIESPRTKNESKKHTRRARSQMIIQSTQRGLHIIQKREWNFLLSMVRD
jgi:hypothetical protein